MHARSLLAALPLSFACVGLGACASAPVVPTACAVVNLAHAACLLVTMPDGRVVQVPASAAQAFAAEALRTGVAKDVTASPSGASRP